MFQYLDFDNLPDTNFTCAGKVIGGYYADLEASCQMFHVCTVGQQGEPMDIKFLCLNGTVFDQVFSTYNKLLPNVRKYHILCKTSGIQNFAEVNHEILICL